jgi:hypothetical protein
MLELTTFSLYKALAQHGPKAPRHFEGHAMSYSVPEVKIGTSLA